MPPEIIDLNTVLPMGDYNSLLDKTTFYYIADSALFS